MVNNYYGQVGLVSSADDYSPKEISLDLGKTFQIPKTGMYKSSDESVATVNTAGLITVVGYGIANIAVNDVTEYTIENKLSIDTNCIYLGVIPTIDSFNNLTLTDVVELIKEGYLTPTVPTKTTINVGGDTLLCLIPNLEYECSKIDDSGEEKLFTGSVKANGEIVLGPFHVYGAVSEGSEYISIDKKLKEIKTSSSGGGGLDDPELDYATRGELAEVKEKVEAADKLAYIENKKANNLNIFGTHDNEAQIDLEMFVVSLRIYSENYNTEELRSDYYDNIRMTEVQVSSSQVGFFFKNAKNEWVLYNTYIPVEQGIRTYTLRYLYYTIKIVLNWDFVPSERIVNNNEGLTANGKYVTNYKIEQSSLSKAEYEDIISQSIVVENLFYKGFDVKDESIVNTISDKGQFQITYDDGLRIIAQGYNGTYEARTNNLPQNTNKYLVHGHKYALFYDVEFFDNIMLHPSDGFYLTMNKYEQICNFYIASEKTYVESHRIQGVAFSQVTSDSSTEVYSYRIQFFKHNNTKSTEKIFDAKFHGLMLIDVTASGLEHKSERELRALFKSTGIFEKLTIANQTSNTMFNSLYQGMNLRSLGDSLPETYAFQPYIAQCFGMKYDINAESVTEDIVWNGETVKRWRSAWGATCVAPLVTSTNERKSHGASVYMRAKSLKYNAPDVLLILAGYNDVHAGEPYVDGGTAVQPEDYGLNDEPYLGGEIDLLSNPQLTDVPSFGACYRGMIENILQDIPYCRIVLCGIPRGSAEAGRYGKDSDWNSKKNAVIERIAKEYGFPYVNLADVYGVNKYNYIWLTQDKLHFNEFGGRRVAMEIIAKAF